MDSVMSQECVLLQLASVTAGRLKAVLLKYLIISNLCSNSSGY